MSITRLAAKAACAFTVCIQPAFSQDLSLPDGAEQVFSTVQDPGVYALPVHAWQPDAGLETQRFEGRISLESWRIAKQTIDPFQLARPLRDALSEAGYEIVLDCSATACGGFDFRFETLVLPAPQMFVKLTEFHFVSARAKDAGAVSILTSRDARDSYVQIIRAGQVTKGKTKSDAIHVLSNLPQDPVKLLELEGHVVLKDMRFKTGSATLDAGRIASLDTIAAHLLARPDRQVLFVGHTDATGSLEANQAVSLKRALAAVRYLREQHDVPSDQISAQGAGYLAPVATNLTEAGRQANRRVEAVLVSTQ
ncbi:MAG: OmpA family protein [Pelagimonas sp.]|nr:OmpA family protein [Pelagimonas sp.]